MDDRPAYAPIFASVYEIARTLETDQQASLLMACCAYAFDGTDPELDGLLGAIFDQVARPSMDRTLDRARASRENGRKRRNATNTGDGQEPTKPKPETNPAGTQTEPSTNPDETQHEASSNLDATKRKASSDNDQRPMTNDQPLPQWGGGGSRGDDAPRAPRFSPPSVEEVAEYGDEFCLERGIPPGSFDAERFHDHFTSNGWRVSGRAPMRDWRAAVRNWIKRDNPDATKGGGGHDIFDGYA